MKKVIIIIFLISASIQTFSQVGNDSIDHAKAYLKSKITCNYLQKLIDTGIVSEEATKQIHDFIVKNLSLIHI